MLLIKQNKIPLIVSQYIESTIIPKAPSTMTKVVAWGSIFLMNKIITNFLKEEKNIKFLKMTEIMNDEGLIDIDEAHETLKFIIQHEPKIEISGWIIDSEDIESLHKIAKEMI